MPGSLITESHPADRDPEGNRSRLRGPIVAGLRVMLASGRVYEAAWEGSLFGPFLPLCAEVA
jgi:hypothetical protein